MSHSRTQAERRRLRARDKAKIARIGRHWWRRRKHGPRILSDEFRAFVETLTNRQRSRWATAGYLGLRGRDVAPIRRSIAR